MKLKLTTSVLALCVAASVSMARAAVATALAPRPVAAQLGQNLHPIEPAFNPLALAKFADTLEARIKGKCVGYEFVVSFRDGQRIARAGGDSRRQPDLPPRKMTVDEKFNVASVSKTVTAAAVLKLLHEKDVSVDSPVAPYLPPTWTLGKNIKTITFRELLTHHSGIRCTTEESYKLLEECVFDGIELADKKRSDLYNNNNFALFRMIIPRLNGFNGAIPFPDGTGAVGNVGLNYSKAYMSYVQAHVFAPAGLSGIQCKPDATPGLCYQYPEPVQAGDVIGHVGIAGPDAELVMQRAGEATDLELELRVRDRGLARVHRHPVGRPVGAMRDPPGDVHRGSGRPAQSRSPGS